MIVLERDGVEKKMKKRNIAIVSVMLFGIVACSNSNKGKETNNPGETYADAQANNFTHLPISKIDDFHARLKDYQKATELDNELRRQSIRDDLAQEASRFEDALIAGIAEESSIKRSAVSAAVLGFSGKIERVDLLRRLASEVANEDRTGAVSIYAAFGLTALAPSIRRLPDGTERNKALDQIAKLTLPRIAPLPDVRRNAVVAYSNAISADRDDDLSPVVSAAENDPDLAVREAAVSELGRLGDEVAVPTIQRSLVAGEKIRTRMIAAIALGMIPSPRSLNALSTALPVESAPEVRGKILVAIGSQGSATETLDLRTLLEGYLIETNSEVQTGAMLGLLQLGDKAAAPALVDAAFDLDPVVRLAAIETLIDFNLEGEDAERQIYPIAERLEDGEKDVASAARKLLRTVTGKNLGADPLVWLNDYFFRKYPDLDPAVRSADSVRPRRNQGSGIQPRSPNGTGSSRNQPSR